MILRRPIIQKREAPMTYKERDARFALLTRLGCIACRLQYGVYSEPTIHHLTGLDSSRLGNGGKADDRETIPLCPRHHQHYGIGVSLHDGIETWEEIYGTEKELLDITNQLIGRMQ
jgi:Recombination enhancement, RecA-dependent nuclease